MASACSATALVVAAAGVGELDLAPANGVRVELIVAGSADLDEFQAVGCFKHLVPPEAARDDDVGLADPRHRFLGRPGLVVPNSGFADGEAGLELIGDMGELYDEVGSFGKAAHGLGLLLGGVQMGIRTSTNRDRE